MGSYLRRQRQRQREEDEQRRRRRHQKQAELDRMSAEDPFLAQMMILSRETGTNPLGERWDTWAVRTSEEAALMVLLRPELREGRSEHPDHAAQLLVVACWNWPAVARMLWQSRSEDLVMPVGKSVLVHQLVRMDEHLAHEIAFEPEWGDYRHGTSSLAGVAAIAWRSIALRLIQADDPRLFTASFEGQTVVRACVRRWPELALEILALAGTRADADLAGRCVSGDNARELLANRRLREMTLTDGTPLAALAVRASEEAATECVRDVNIAALRLVDGRTLAHEAIQRTPHAATEALRDPSVAALADSDGATVRAAAVLRRPTPANALRALHQRTLEIVTRASDRGAMEKGSRGR